MKDWLIRLLGGVPKDEYNAAIALCEFHYDTSMAEMQEKLDKALKNDTPKDPKTGRFVKK